MYNSYIEKKNQFNIEFYVSLIFNYFVHNVDARNEVAIYYKGELVRYRNYREIGITLPNFTFKELFKSIVPEHIITLIKLILLERKLILIKSDCSKNAIIIESLFQLICPLYLCFLYPSQWQFINISYLTSAMIDYIDAPMPYIVGIPRDIWNKAKAKKVKTLTSDVAIFDIDEKKLQYKESLPDVPKEVIKVVYEAMQNIMKSKNSAKDVSDL